MTGPSASRSIVDAARRLVDHGVDAVNVWKVAADVGLAPTAIYWHVGSRGAC